jgi:hypothetical protein
MSTDIQTYILTLSFSLLVACMFTSLVCGAVVFFKSRGINAALKHPFLEHRPFERYPMAIRASILLDYFFRLAFPGSKLWLIGNANKLLAHVDPKKTPLAIKWPIIGFWGACWLGLIAMISLWVLMLMRM